MRPSFSSCLLQVTGENESKAMVVEPPLLNILQSLLCRAVDAVKVSQQPRTQLQPQLYSAGEDSHLSCPCSLPGTYTRYSYYELNKYSSLNSCIPYIKSEINLQY